MTVWIMLFLERWMGMHSLFVSRTVHRCCERGGETTREMDVGKGGMLLVGSGCSFYEEQHVPFLSARIYCGIL